MNIRNHSRLTTWTRGFRSGLKRVAVCLVFGATGLVVQSANAANKGVPDASNRDVVFIEDNTLDYQALAKGAQAGTEVHVLNSAKDGLAEMARILAGREGLTALHIVSHGSTAALHLGSLNLNAENLEAHTQELNTISRALHPNAEILLYGCDVAKGSAGTTFVSALARQTHTSVAASTDLTGSIAQGGNWILEYATGRINGNLAFSDKVLTGYSGVLAAPVLDLGSAPGTTVALASAAAGLAPAATASDADINWDTGSLTVQRVATGGVVDGSVNDVFSFVAGGSFNSSATMIRGVDATGTLSAGVSFATWAYTSASGRLVVTFNANATNALVQDVVRHIGYNNATPYGDAIIRFSLSDNTPNLVTADALVTSSTIYVDQTAYDATGIAADGFNLAEALAIAKNGDNILIKDGVYRGQFVATKAVTIDAVNGASGAVTLEAPDIVSQVASVQNSINGKKRFAVLDLRSSVPGSGTITVRNLNIDGRYTGDTQANDPGYVNWLIGIASYDSNALIDHVNIQHIAAPLDGSGNYEGISRHFGIAAEGSTALATAVTVTIKNSTIGTFQKTGIVAWGPRLNAVIQNNTISGVGILGLSAQNGMQIGSFGPRAGTTATISGNTVNNLGAPDALAHHPTSPYVSTGIYPVYAGVVEAYNNTITLSPSASNDSLIGFDVSYTSESANLHDNTLSGMLIGIQVDSALLTAVHTFTNNTLSTSGGNPIVYWYDPAGNGDVGGETLASFGPGAAIRVVGENFSAGTVTIGNGSSVAANSIQITASGGTTALYIDATTAGGSVSPLPLTLNGTYQVGNFTLSGEYIRYVLPQTISFGTAPSLVVGGTGSVIATASSGLAVTYTSTTPIVCSVSGTTVTGLTIGTCVIAANQAGNASYGAAAQVTQNITVGPTTRTIVSGPSQGNVSATNNWVLDTGTSGGVPRSAGFISALGDPSGKSPPSLAPGVTFPYGLFDFTLISGSIGSAATITITYPSVVPAGAGYWKYGPSPAGYNCLGAACATAHWYQMPPAQAVFAGNTVTLTIFDGGVGDDDLTANGVIVDAGGPGIPGATTGIPTLSEWGLFVLSGLMVLFGLVQVRRRGSDLSA